MHCLDDLPEGHHRHHHLPVPHLAIPDTKSNSIQSSASLEPPVKAHVIFLKFTDPDSSVTRLHLKTEAALELGVITVEVNVVHVATSPGLPSRV